MFEQWYIQKKFIHLGGMLEKGVIPSWSKCNVLNDEDDKTCSDQESAQRRELEVRAYSVSEEIHERVVYFLNWTCVDVGYSDAHANVYYVFVYNLSKFTKKVSINQDTWKVNIKNDILNFIDRKLFNRAQSHTIIICLSQLKMERKESTLCRLHTLKAVVMGSCITCTSSSPICETKGCIKHHSESQKMHTSYTIKDIQKITEDFINTNQEKRKILNRIITEYFQLLKAQIQSLYHQVTHSLQNLKFQNFLMDENERKLSDLLVMKRYSELTCEDVARVVPKMIKCASFQQKQFNHLKDFLISSKENLPKTVNSMILNLPYFRQDQTLMAVQKFSQISDELLSMVNKKLQALNFRPKKLRIKYSNHQVIQVRMMYEFSYLGNRNLEYFQTKIGEKFIKLLENNIYLKEVQYLELYCVWNIREEDFQIEFLDAVLSYPFLTALTIYTGYRVTSTNFIQQMVQNKNIELKIYKKQWHF